MDFKRDGIRSEVLSSQNILPLRARRPESTGDAVGLSHPVERFLASTGGSNGGWDGRKLQMTQDACDHRFLGDGSNDPERTMLAKRTGGHIQIKHTCQQPHPTPERRFCAVITSIHALLGRDPVTHDDSVRQIERRQTLSDREFWYDFVAAKRPVIVAGAVKDWPALSKWKPEYLQSRLAGKTVNVTTSSTRVHNPYEKGSVQKISFDEAVRAMLSGGPLQYHASADSGGAHRTERGHQSSAFH
jgi:hypothetical protein